MRRIASRQNPLVARYRAAARGESSGVMLLDGVHLVGDALAAGVHVSEAAVATEAEADEEVHAILAGLEAAHVETVAVTAAVLSAISPVRSPSPIVALAERPRRASRIASGAEPLLVAAVDVQDPGNLGAIVRVAEAGGASGVVVAGASADPFGWKALRGSMGSALRLPIHPIGDADPLAALRAYGCRIVATSPRGGQSLFDADLTGPIAIVIGGEGGGLPVGQLVAADEVVTIPMQRPVESLNAAVTAALLVYEAARQRAAMKTRTHETV